MPQELIRLDKVVRTFGALAAVDAVSTSIGAAEIVGLIGPNGSGKSTLVNLISGALRPTSGRVYLGGEDATGWSSQRRCHWGLGRTRQIARPLAGMSVFENVLVGALFGSGGLIGRREASAVAESALVETGLDAYADEFPPNLPIQKLKLLEMARALATQPKVLLLDEIVAGLTAGEAGAILDLIDRQRAAGRGILLIEHRLHEVLRLSDRVIVLNAGRLLRSGTPAEIVEDPTVLAAYTGAAGVANVPAHA